MDATSITPEIAAHVLHHFGNDGGYPASNFKTQLLNTIAVADALNRPRIAAGFPGYVAAFNLAQNQADGTAILQKIAASDEDGDEIDGDYYDPHAT